LKHLRQTPTNASDDSKGHSLGLEGDQFLIVIAGLVAGVILLLVCMQSGASPGLSLTMAAMPIPLCVGFLVIFKIGKPPRYARDLIQKWAGHKSLCRTQSRTNPYYQILNKIKKEEQ
jgi:hypothetical protein